MNKNSGALKYKSVCLPNVNFLYLFVFCLFLTNCSSLADSESRKTSLEYKDGAKLSVFINLNRPDVPEIEIHMTSLEILTGDEWHSLIETPVTLNTKKIGKEQRFLSRNLLPFGTYTGLRCTFEEAFLVQKENRTPIEITKKMVQVSLPESMELKPFSSESIFLDWNVDDSLDRATIPQAIISATTSRGALLITNLAYVACPEINTVYIIRIDKNWVAGSIGLSGGPTYLDVDTSLKRLYVLSSDDATIKVIDLNTNLVLDNIKIPMTKKPVYMCLSPDKQIAFVLDGRGNYLVRMDLQTGVMTARQRIGQRPKFLLYIDSMDRLALSSSMEQMVYLLDPIDLNILETINVGSSPQGLQSWGNLLYIADSASNTVSVYDLNARKNLEKINVGYSPRRIVATEKNLFVSNFMEGTVSVLLGGKSRTVKEIKTGKKPLEMAVSTIFNWLYIGDEGEKAISIVDTSNNREQVGSIFLDTPPAGISILQ